jgi:hypothetical protein
MFVYLEVHAYTVEIYCFITGYIALLYIMKVLTANNLYSRDTCTWFFFFWFFLCVGLLSSTLNHSPPNVYTISDYPNEASLEEKKK